jgi:glyoxylase-like metal-dependent hydrolase (beta-lactamase superfamily II)
MKPEVVAFFDEDTFTVSYVVRDPNGTMVAIIDSILDYDQKSGRTTTASADKIIEFVRARSLQVSWILETHVHADHLTAAPYLKEKLGGKVGIGRHVTDIQRIFSKVFNVETSFALDGSQFDRLFDDGEEFATGALQGRVMHTPGHTPACVSYVFGDAVFVGDTMFMPDYGTARTDFPGGDAAQLYRSIRRILSLSPDTRLFMCHDYKAPGRDFFAWESSVADQRARNLHIKDGIEEASFVSMRQTRDKTLPVPVLLLPSVQVNMRAGAFPPAESNGVSYLKVPINLI